jgi:hypothetical protein
LSVGQENAPPSEQEPQIYRFTPGSRLALKSELVYCSNMSSVHGIQSAVSKLSRQELLAFRDWFSGFDAGAWDKQFEEDVATGHLDTLADEAIRDLREGRCQDL